MTQAPVQTADISGLATQVSLGNHEALTSSVHGISAFGATLVDDADAATARTTLDVDQAGTDNSTDVTLATVANNYLSLSGQEITAGVIPVSLGGTGSGDLATARANLGLGTAATTASTDYATEAQGTLADSALQPGNSINELGDVGTSGVTDGQALIWDSFANQWQPGDAGASAIDDLSDVDTSTVPPTTNDFLNWDGSNWVPAVPTADVDTPLTTALRGTTNPHIGAYPNQSFKVIDNPYQSVMVVADEVGNLKLLNSLGVNNIAIGFSVIEDGDEPDIEAVSGSERYSVISGDSDTKGANGLPLRQGFNNPDIGANPAPILISGGSIA
jgi:hypothetical protein